MHGRSASSYSRLACWSSHHLHAPAGAQGACQQDVATTFPRLPNQCVITLAQPLLNNDGAASPLVLLNVYARAMEVNGAMNASNQQYGGAILSQTAGRMWLVNVTLEGSSQSFTAGGNALIVSASNASQTAHIGPVMVSATRCTFMGVTGEAGAAVELNANGTGHREPPLVTASLENCTMQDNLLIGGGGAVHVGTGAALRMSQCTFEDNVRNVSAADNGTMVCSGIFVC
jgi:hypothetical protein